MAEKPYVIKEIERISSSILQLSNELYNAIGDGTITIDDLNQAIGGIIASIGEPDGIVPLDGEGLIDVGFLPDTEKMVEHGNEWHSEVYVTQNDIDNSITSYSERRDNPNEVTKEQVGLSNVDDIKQEPYQDLGLNAKTASSPPNSYPKGISHFLGDNTTGFPYTFTGVITYNLNSNNSCFQFGLDYNNNRSPRIKIRSATQNNSTWGDWDELSLMSDLSELAGEGRTTETVKGISDELDSKYEKSGGDIDGDVSIKGNVHFKYIENMKCLDIEVT